MKKRRDIFTGIELGSDMIRVIVASFQEQGRPDSDLVVRGFAEVPAMKVLKDEPVIPNIVADQLRQALSTAWEMSAVEGLPGVLSLALSGDYIQTQRVNATVDLDSMISISDEDYQDAMRATYAEVISQQENDSQNIYPLPLISHGFRLADDRFFFNPVGQYSPKLTAESICFPTDKLRYDKINTLIRSVDPRLLLDHVVYAPVAVASAVIPPTIADEPQGLVIDLGTGMTSYAIPTKIGFAACEQLAVGLDHLANDLSIAFTLNIDTARQIVRSLSELNLTIVATKDGSTRLFTVTEKGSGLPTRQIPASSIEDVMELRMRETFQIIKRRLEEQGVYQWAGNEILLTGVGATLPRITELAGTVFGRRVRAALPYRVAGRGDFLLGNRHAIVMGLIRAACVEECLQAAQEAAEGGILGKIKNWFTVATDC